MVISAEVDPEEMRLAARTLLVRPLLRAGGPDARIAAIVRRPQYRTRLQHWFDHNLGWRLVVDRDVVRLQKVPESRAFHPADAPSQRCCVLYCLLLAGLEDCGEQTVISELAERVALLASSRPEIPGYDSTQFRDRRDLVKAIRLLVEHGALVPTRDEAATEQDEQSFVAGDGNAIYDVDHRAAALLMACPVPPTRAGAPGGLTRQPAPDTVDGVNRRRRHALMRRLVDDPVVYFDDLPDDQLEYFRLQRSILLRELKEMLDVQVEVRAEGVAVVDEKLTDLQFPKERTAQFAALLLAEAIAVEPGVNGGDNVVIGSGRLAELAAEVAVEVARKVKTIEQRPVSADAVADVALKVLTALRIVEPVRGGVRPLAVLGRFRSPVHREMLLPEPMPLVEPDRPSARRIEEDGDGR